MTELRIERVSIMRKINYRNRRIDQLCIKIAKHFTDNNIVKDDLFYDAIDNTSEMYDYDFEVLGKRLDEINEILGL